MKTAVQVRLPAGQERPESQLLWGSPCATVAGALGPIALFGPGELVAYRIRYRRRARVFVFRTLDVDDRLAAWVPGVRPRVELLLELGTHGRVRLVRSLFPYLAKRALDPTSLPDAFYVRVGVALAGRLPSHKVLVSLIRRSVPAAALTRHAPAQVAPTETP